MKLKTKAIQSNAVYSKCKQYRYVLERRFSTGSGCVNFILLNPSTADELHNDNTIAKCENWAINNGYEIMLITNVFSYKSTNPKNIMKCKDPVGEHNDLYIHDMAALSNTIICGWGNHGLIKERHETVLKLLKNHKLKCFKVNKNDTPSHPLHISINKLRDYNVIY